MLSKKVEETLNNQVKLEAYSANLYLSMASWADKEGFPGASEFLYEQYNEENTHMLKIFQYINDREGHAIVPAIEQPPSNFNSIKEIFEKTLEHEKFISSKINELVAVCMSETDFTTVNFLQWYVNEQIEEERTARTILDRLKMLGGDTAKMYLFDRDLKDMRTIN